MVQVFSSLVEEIKFKCKGLSAEEITQLNIANTLGISLSTFKRRLKKNALNWNYVKNHLDEPRVQRSEPVKKKIIQIVEEKKVIPVYKELPTPEEITPAFVEEVTIRAMMNPSRENIMAAEMGRKWLETKDRTNMNSIKEDEICTTLKREDTTDLLLFIKPSREESQSLLNENSPQEDLV